MDIKKLLESKLLAFDNTLDLSANSILQKTVIAPIVEAFTINPTDLGTRDFLIAKFEEAFPNMPIARGSAISDVLISTNELFFESYRQELDRLKNAQSIQNINLLTDDDAQALAANWFVGRSVGTRSSGIVRITVDRVSPIIINQSLITFLTDDGKQFRPSVSRTISNEELIAGQTGINAFTFDVFCESLVTGGQYNIEAGEITTVVGINNATLITNPSAFTGGLNPDTVEGLLTTKLPRAISERSLVTARGIAAKVSTLLSPITRIQVIGLGDEEMKRDRVSYESISKVIGNGVCYTNNRLVLLSFIPFNLSDELVAGAKLKLVTFDSVNLQSTRSVTLEATVSEIVFTSDTTGLLNQGKTCLVYIEENIGNIGAMVSVYIPHKAIIEERIVDNSLSLGGRSDIYVHPSSEQILSNIIKASPSSKKGNYGLGISHINDNIFRLTHSNYVESSVKVLDRLYVRPYIDDTIIGVKKSNFFTDVYLLNTSIDLFNFVDNDTLPWKTTSDVEIILNEDLETIYPNEQEQELVVIGSIQSNAAFVNVNLAQHGVRKGDILYIEDIDANYTIDGIFRNRLILNKTFPQTINRSIGKVLREKENLPSPISYFNSVTLEDQNLPYGHPLGLHINNMGVDGNVTHYGEGLISPSFYYALKNYIAEVSGNVANIAAVSLRELRKSHYRIYTLLEESESIDDIHTFVLENPNAVIKNKRLNNLKPFSHGYEKPLLGATVLTSVNANSVGAPETDDDFGPGRGDGSGRIYFQNAFVTETQMFNEMFLKDTRNIFIMLGPIEEKEAYAKYPGEGIVEGDILTIESGINKGKYVIAEVIHNRIRSRIPDPLINAVSVENIFPNITRVDLNAHQGRISDTIQSLDKPTFQKITILKIYGEFPYNPYRDVEKYLEFEGWNNYQGVNAQRLFYPLTHQDIRLMLNNPVALLDIDPEALKAEIMNKMFPVYRITPGVPLAIPNDVLNNLVQTYIDSLSVDAKVTYTINKPAIGTAELKLLDTGMCRLYPPTKSIIPTDTINELLLGGFNVVSEYEIPKYSEFTWGSDTFCLTSNNKTYLLSDSEVSNWPTNLTPQLFRNNKITSLGFQNWRFQYGISNHSAGSAVVSNIDDVDLIKVDYSILDYPSLQFECNLCVYEERYAQQLLDYLPNSVSFLWLPYIYKNVQSNINVPAISIDEIVGLALEENGDVFLFEKITRVELLASITPEELNSYASSGDQLLEVINSFSNFLRFTLDDPTLSPNFLLNTLYPVTGDAVNGYTYLDPNNYSLSILSYPEISYYNFDNESVLLTNTLESLPTITLASISSDTTEIDLVRQTGRTENFFSDTLGWGTVFPLVGSMAVLTQRGQKFTRTVTYSDVNGKINIDEPLPNTDASIVANGICYIDRDGYIYVGSSPTRGYNDEGTGLEVLLPTVDTGLNNGGSTRPFISTDVGKHITLWGLVVPFVGRELVLSDDQRDLDNIGPNPALEEREFVLNNAYAPIRTTLGTASISSIDTTTKNSVLDGTEYVFEQKVTLAEDSIITDFSELGNLVLDDGKFIRCLYVVTENTVEINSDPSIINNLTQIQFFDPIPEEYNVLGRSISGENYLAITNEAGDLVGPSFTDVNNALNNTSSTIFKYTDYATDSGNVSILTSFNKNNPYNIKGISTSLHGDKSILNIQSVNMSQNVVGETIDIDNYFIPGYTISSVDELTARSTKESNTIKFPAYLANGDLNDLSVGLSAVYTPIISQLQAILDNRLDRVVCSDSLAKRMSPAFIGVKISYVGGPDENTVAEKISTLINNSVLTYTSLAKSDFINLIYELGAAKVSLPITIYMCVEDNSRKIYRRELIDVLDASRLKNIDISTRITSISAAPYGSSALGATLEISKKSIENNFIGSGGS